MSDALSLFFNISVRRYRIRPRHSREREFTWRQRRALSGRSRGSVRTRTIATGSVQPEAGSRTIPGAIRMNDLDGPSGIGICNTLERSFKRGPCHGGTSAGSPNFVSARRLTEAGAGFPLSSGHVARARRSCAPPLCCPATREQGTSRSRSAGQTPDRRRRAAGWACDRRRRADELGAGEGA